MREITVVKEMQNLTGYTEKQHHTWRRLLSTQLANLNGKVPQQFCEGLAKIQDLIQDIPDIEAVSNFLYRQVGWKLWPVRALLDAEDYFQLLSMRYLPVATYFRNGDNLNYSPIPDIWHDIFGHIPLVFFPEYCNFVEYLGYRCVTSKKSREFIARIYWYTIEAGICQELEGRRVYGASQLSSIEEISYSVSDKPTVIPFDLARVINSPVKIDEFQNVIFEIPSFDYLQVLQSQLEALYI